MPAPATIELPAVLQWLLLGDGADVAELREMFENLLVASMDRDSAASAHPAFVSVISQLTPDEARILKSIDRNDYALYTLREYADTSKSLGFRTTLGTSTGIEETRQREYISNLVRLGTSDQQPNAFKRRSVRSAERNRRGRIWGPSPQPSSHGGSIEVTPLGTKFLDTCVRPLGR